MAVIAEPIARLDRSREVLLVWTLSAEQRQGTLSGADQPRPGGGAPASQEVPR